MCLSPFITFDDQFVEGATCCFFCGLSAGEVNEGTLLGRYQVNGVHFSELVEMTSGEKRRERGR